MVQTELPENGDPRQPLDTSARTTNTPLDTSQRTTANIFSPIPTATNLPNVGAAPGSNDTQPMNMLRSIADAFDSNIAFYAADGGYQAVAGNANQWVRVSREGTQYDMHTQYVTRDGNIVPAVVRMQTNQDGNSVTRSSIIVDGVQYELSSANEQANLNLNHMFTATRQGYQAGSVGLYHFTDMENTLRSFVENAGDNNLHRWLEREGAPMHTLPPSVPGEIPNFSSSQMPGRNFTYSQGIPHGATVSQMNFDATLTSGERFNVTITEDNRIGIGGQTNLRSGLTSEWLRVATPEQINSILTPAEIETIRGTVSRAGSEGFITNAEFDNLSATVHRALRTNDTDRDPNNGGRGGNNGR